MRAAANQQMRSLLERNPLVLKNRPVRPGTNTARLSRFADDRWDLTPGIFEDHSTKISLLFDEFPVRWRAQVKEYFWILINDETVRPLPAAQLDKRVSLRTISFIRSPLARVLTWADQRGFDELGEFTPVQLELILDDISDLPLSINSKGMMISETRRLWAYRDAVPEVLRLPERQPWLGELAQDLLGRSPKKPGNRTPRISDATLIPLVSWAIRFVDDFSADIVGSFNEYCRMLRYERRHRLPGVRPEIAEGSPQQRIVAALNQMSHNGRKLPGRILKDGSRDIQWRHLERLAQTSQLSPVHKDLVRSFGLEIDDDAYLNYRCEGTIEGRIWRSRPISFQGATGLAQHLVTACFILISYLSGMRPGEVLSLERDCAIYDPNSRLWKVHGRRWKGVRTEDGSKEEEGRQREVPWVVHPIVARAVAVLTELHSETLLFPLALRPKPVRYVEVLPGARPGKALTSSQVGADIVEFVDWVNAYCEEYERSDRIPPDSAGRVSPSRFRRTLAWHIVREPRGLVAAAIQYGHIATHVTQGYAGTLSSGFPDDLALERWLERLEDVDEVERYLDSGGHVSGPAAQELERRTRRAKAKFGGRAMPTSRQADKLLGDPTLQVFKGRGMHCVFNKAISLCTKESDEEPRLRECRSGCGNIARTDEDIADVRMQADSLPDDPLAPSIRYERIEKVRESLNQIIEDHEER